MKDCTDPSINLVNRQYETCNIPDQQQNNHQYEARSAS